MKAPTQQQLVLAYVLHHGSITPDEARENCGKCERLGARAWNIKRLLGWPIWNPGEGHGGEHAGIHARYTMDWGAIHVATGYDLPEIRRVAFAYASKPEELGAYSKFMMYLVDHAAKPLPKTERMTEKDRFGQLDLWFHGGRA